MANKNDVTNAKKAIVEILRQKVNYRLADKRLSQEVKAELCVMLSSMLSEVDSYHGFNYIYWLNGGYDAWVKDGEPYPNTPYLGNEYDRIYY